MRLSEEELAEIRGWLKPNEPTGQEEPTCAACNASVEVEDGMEWDDGDLCHECTALRAARMENAAGKLLNELDALRSELVRSKGEAAAERIELRKERDAANARAERLERELADERAHVKRATWLLRRAGVDLSPLRAEAQPPAEPSPPTAGDEGDW